jgi:hypothetical protein
MSVLGSSVLGAGSVSHFRQVCGSSPSRSNVPTGHVRPFDAQAACDSVRTVLYETFTCYNIASFEHSGARSALITSQSAISASAARLYVKRRLCCSVLDATSTRSPIRGLFVSDTSHFCSHRLQTPARVRISVRVQHLTLACDKRLLDGNQRHALSHLKQRH